MVFPWFSHGFLMVGHYQRVCAASHSTFAPPLPWTGAGQWLSQSGPCQNQGLTAAIYLLGAIYMEYMVYIVYM